MELIPMPIFRTPNDFDVSLPSKFLEPSITTDGENDIATEEVRDKDLTHKTKGKIYKRKAHETPLILGDKVYLSSLVKENKLTPNFNGTPYTVVKKNGSDFQVRNDETGQELRRNVVHLKKIEGDWKVVSKKQDENGD